MGQFLKMLLASCLGVFLALCLISLIGIGITTRLATMAAKPARVEPNSILHLTFDSTIPEQTNNLEMPIMPFKKDKVLGLNDMLYAIDAAAKDDNIKGIFLEVDQLGMGFATAGTLRSALQQFKDQGKFVISYSKSYTQGAYYMCSMADQIYINPYGLLDFRGFAAQMPFFKDMLDKIGVKMQVFYAGKFKSATEPYRRNDMSPENRLQLREFLDQVYTQFLGSIGKSRNVEVAELKRLADGYLASEPEEALRFHLVDAVGYRDEALSDLRKRLGLEEDEKIKFTKIEDYFESNPPKSNFKTKDKIAILYAEGNIVDGKGEMGNIGDDRYVKAIERIAKDDKIKAVVLRVNSPGGSAMSSENIWRALTLLKEKNIPLVVSMGDYAASGGYYISCIADSIVAESNTLTGSIGVFHVLPNVKSLLDDKLGIHFDSVKTGRFATGFSPMYDLSEEESRYLQKFTDKVYETFLKRVSDGRHMSRDAVNEIAQGRVWTGEKAREIGLVDRLGNLQDAINMAGRMAGIEQYRTVEYPTVKEPLQVLIEELTGQEDETRYRSSALRSQLGEWYPYYKLLDEIRTSNGTQARLPVIVPFK